MDKAGATRKLRECPFNHPGWERLYVTSNGAQSFYVECEICGAQGPSANNEIDAMKRWNGERVVKEASNG